jgi:membrane protease subunit HflK
MAWNEPGGSGNKDPWGNNSGGGKNQGPPDLDEVLKKFQNKFGGLFGGKGGGGEGVGGQGPGSGAIGLVVVVIIAIWALSGIYIIEPAERGVVTRFGAYAETTQPGPHWHLPYPIETVEVVDVDQIRNVEVGFRQSGGRDAATVPQESLMLTQDENIVDIKFAVQYRVKEAKDYLFNVRDPDSTLRQATESAIRESVGKSKMDFVLI